MAPYSNGFRFAFLFHRIGALAALLVTGLLLGGSVGLAQTPTDGYAFIPPTACAATATTTAFSPTPGFTRAAAGNTILTATTNTTAGTVAITCDLDTILTRLLVRNGSNRGTIIYDVGFLYGIQTTAMTSIATPVLNTVTYPASTAAGAAATGTVAAAGGTLTVTPTALQLTVTTTGQCFNERMFLATPYPMVSDNVHLTFEQVFTTAGSTATTIQVCGLYVHFSYWEH